MSNSVQCPGGIPSQWRIYKTWDGDFKMADCGMCGQIIKVRKIGGLLSPHDMDYNKQNKQGLNAKYYWSLGTEVDPQVYNRPAEPLEEQSA